MMRSSVEIERKVCRESVLDGGFQQWFAARVSAKGTEMR